MMEQCGDLPFPGISSGTDDVLMHIHFSDSQYKNEYGISRNKVKDHVRNMLQRDNPQYSYASWIIGGCNHYVKEIRDFLERRKQARHKIKCYVKTCAFMYLIYIHVLEKRYKPGGLFETEMSLKWNPLLKAI